jgi:prepilin-type N-terminal cleavage/methylation domain-containing protein
VRLVVSGTTCHEKAPIAGAFCFRDSRGFSIIELLAVIAIVGVLLVFATPRFMDVLPYEERGYAEEVAAGLRYSRAVAVASGCNVLFSILPGVPGGYNAAQRAPAAAPFAGHCAPAGAWVTPVNRADGTPLSGTPPTRATPVAATQVEFNEDGDVVGGAVVIPVGPHVVAVMAGGGVVVQ